MRNIFKILKLFNKVWKRAWDTNTDKSGNEILKNQDFSRFHSQVCLRCEGLKPFFKFSWKVWKYFSHLDRFHSKKTHWDIGRSNLAKMSIFFQSFLFGEMLIFFQLLLGASEMLFFSYFPFCFLKLLNEHMMRVKKIGRTKRQKKPFSSGGRKVFIWLKITNKLDFLKILKIFLICKIKINTKRFFCTHFSVSGHVFDKQGVFLGYPQVVKKQGPLLFWKSG